VGELFVGVRPAGGQRNSDEVADLGDGERPRCELGELVRVEDDAELPFRAFRAFGCGFDVDRALAVEAAQPEPNVVSVGVDEVEGLDDGRRVLRVGRGFRLPDRVVWVVLAGLVPVALAPAVGATRPTRRGRLRRAGRPRLRSR
jgi:hypothetical protein